MSEPRVQSSAREPKLRHEFVGMMFAVAIGEVGLQTAALVQAGHLLAFLPAYSHLLLATVVIATSWVGWTLSQAQGARIDVAGIFELEFLVLLLDVVLVIIYFILVRSVDFGREKDAPRIESAQNVAYLVLSIFILYFVWDLLTKVFIFWKHRDKSKTLLRHHYNSWWWRTHGSRTLPSLVCIILSCVTVHFLKNVDRPHILTADFALISLVLLFRALKAVPLQFGRNEAEEQFSLEEKERRKRAKKRMLGFLLALLLGLLWSARSLPLPSPVVEAIQNARYDR